MKFAIIALLLSSCAPARSDDVHIQMTIAPDGTQCYIIMQNGEARGGNCK
jgi:hypothetical protein